MAYKQTVVSELGDEELLAPDLIARALIANDQVKYYFALLQTAQENAERPRMPAPDLRAERLASQLADEWLDEVVPGTVARNGGTYRVPHGADILRRIGNGIETMVQCLPAAERAPFLERLAVLAPSTLEGNEIPGKLISALTSGDRDAGDSLHLVVMDAHRAINRLQAETAVETIAGAKVHNLSPAGRPRVEAFMAGVNGTAPLKFDHPGLGTTATEHDGSLLIQNDIGTTDAHVMVVRVRGRDVTLTYTDIHAARLRFFKSLFEAFDMAWEGTERRQSDALSDGQYLLASGSYRARDEDALLAFLTHLGSRIVFLIDWNHMRRRLRRFVGKSRAVEVLKWAAENEVGHRGLIEIGDDRALAEAVEYAAGKQFRYGQRLDEMISKELAVEFLREAMRLASTGLRQRRSRRVIQDEINARLRRYFERERLGIFDMAASQAAFGYDIAFFLCEALERLGAANARDWVARFSARAKSWEAAADVLLNDARQDIKRFQRPPALQQYFEYADDAIDELEEAAALVDLALVISLPAAALDRLRALADLPLRSAQELVKCVECAA